MKTKQMKPNTTVAVAPVAVAPAVGLKEQVKCGLLSAVDAMNKLRATAKSNAANGSPSPSVENIHTARWLKRRINHVHA